MRNSGRETYIVMTNDGHRFWCETRDVAGQLRWVIIDTDRTPYNGPPVSDRSPEAVQTMVDEWWAIRKSDGRD